MSRFRLLTALTLVICSGLFAQTPKTISFVKVRVLEQTTAANVNTVGGYFVAAVDVGLNPPAGVVVQLRGPAGTVTLNRLPDGTFEYDQDFGSLAALSASFPDGAYTATVSGGSANSTTPFQVTTDSNVGPARISNFDALQAWPDGYPRVEFDRVTNRTSLDFAGLTVLSPSGTSLYDAGSFDLSASTSITVPGASVPFGQTLPSLFTYIRYVNSTANSGTTNIGVASGFMLQFTIQCVTSAPRIVNQPVSRVAFIGATATIAIGVDNSAKSLSYQLYKDGVAVTNARPNMSYGGTTEYATFEVPVTQASDAGTYTIEVSNPTGSVRSAPARIIVAPAVHGTVLAGSPSVGSLDGSGTAAAFSAPMGLAVDPAGNLFVADWRNSTIRKVTATGVVTTFAGSAGQIGSTDGVGSAARFTSPTALAFDGAGNLWVTDAGNHTIRRITPAGQVATVAGSAGLAGAADGVGANARFNSPQGLAIDANGVVYVSDTQNHTIRRIKAGGAVDTYIGVASPNISLEPLDGIGAAARLVGPRALALDGTGQLYVADSSMLRRISSNGEVTTLVGFNSPAHPPAVDTGRGDGLGVGPFMDIAGLGIDRSGTIYLAEWYGIVRIVPGGTIIRMPVSYKDPVRNVDTAINHPLAFAMGPDGTFYLAEETRLYRATLQAGSADPMVAVVSAPRSQTVAVGSSVAFSVDATAPAASYQWLKDGVGIAGATDATYLIPNTSAADAGTYSVLIANAAGALGANAATLAISTSTDFGRLVNLSVRAQAGTGAQTLTVGLGVGGGAGGATAPVLIRGIGPGLRPYGVTDPLADPKIDLLNGSQILASNNDWGGAQVMSDTFTGAGAFSLAPTSLDSAMTRSLGAGAYTVQITATNGQTGTALAEIYDLNHSPSASAMRITNLSTRAMVGSGSDVLIAGFVVGGSTSKTLLIRGIGPTLAGYGVTNSLSDPQLAVYSGTERIAGNDNWGGQGTLEQTFGKVGAFPLSSYSADAALIVTLPPGAYTAQVSGAAGTSGIALIEVYELP